MGRTSVCQVTHTRCDEGNGRSETDFDQSTCANNEWKSASNSRLCTTIQANYLHNNQRICTEIWCSIYFARSTKMRMKYYDSIRRLCFLKYCKLSLQIWRDENCHVS